LRHHGPDLLGWKVDDPDDESIQQIALGVQRGDLRAARLYADFRPEVRRDSISGFARFREVFDPHERPTRNSTPSKSSQLIVFITSPSAALPRDSAARHFRPGAAPYG